MRIVVLFFFYSALTVNAYANIKREIKDKIEGFTDPTTGILMIPFIPTLISLTYTQSQNYHKLIIAKSKSDAASYIASDGEVKAVYLEQALILLREDYPNTSDMELAKAILAY